MPHTATYIYLYRKLTYAARPTFCFLMHLYMHMYTYMYMYIYVYMYMYMHTDIYRHICRCIFKRIHLQVHTFCICKRTPILFLVMYMRMYMYMHTDDSCMYVYMHGCMRMYMYIYVHVYIYAYMYMYMYIYSDIHWPTCREVNVNVYIYQFICFAHVNACLWFFCWMSNVLSILWKRNCIYIYTIVLYKYYTCKY